MDLREYVVALSVVCRPAQTLDTIQLAFKASAQFHMSLMYGDSEVGYRWSIPIGGRADHSQGLSTP